MNHRVTRKILLVKIVKFKRSHRVELLILQLAFSKSLRTVNSLELLMYLLVTLVGLSGMKGVLGGGVLGWVGCLEGGRGMASHFLDWLQRLVVHHS